MADRVRACAREELGAEVATEPVADSRARGDSLRGHPRTPPVDSVPVPAPDCRLTNRGGRSPTRRLPGTGAGTTAARPICSTSSGTTRGSSDECGRRQPRARGLRRRRVRARRGAALLLPPWDRLGRSRADCRGRLRRATPGRGGRSRRSRSSCAPAAGVSCSMPRAAYPCRPSSGRRPPATSVTTSCRPARASWCGPS